jgi:hypothetical protein
MKVCSKCKIEKPVGEFHTDNSRNDGLHYNCRSCTKDYDKGYYEEHKDNLLERKRGYSKQPEVRQRRNQQKSYKFANDPIYRMMVLAGRMVLRSYTLADTKKSEHTFDYLGWTAQEAVKHQEQFLGKGCEDCKATIITLENSHLDHLLPVNMISKLYPKDTILLPAQKEHIKIVLRELNQLRNLRLICKVCNLKKRNKLLWSNQAATRALAQTI